MIILDDYELDETEPGKFKENIELVNLLYNKRNERTKIHFTFVSPINNNYIKQCVIYGMELIQNSVTSSLGKKILGKIYYPFIYYSTCLFDPYNNLSKDEYKKKIYKKNKGELNIQENLLDKLNYNLYHLTYIKNEVNEKLDKKAIEEKIKDYLNILEKKSDEIVSSFYTTDNKLYKYDLDKVKEYNNLIEKEKVDYDELKEILKVIPLSFISFYPYVAEENEINDNSKELFKVCYLNGFYKNSINNYLQSFQMIDYEIDKNKKPGEKGDILEELVIKSIKGGYFSNFKPDITIEIKSIYKLSQYDDEGQKNKFEDEIKKFEEIFSNKKMKLIMITQSNPNGKKYDIAFLHQYEDGKYQFILVQVTRRKEKKEMRQYTNVKCDCYSFANFFALFNDIRLKRYHFAFIFQGGYNQNKQNMSFCIKHNIKFFKFQ